MSLIKTTVMMKMMNQMKLFRTIFFFLSLLFLELPFAFGLNGDAGLSAAGPVY